MHCVGRLELIMPTRGLHAVGFRERRSGGVELGKSQIRNSLSQE